MAAVAGSVLYGFAQAAVGSLFSSGSTINIEQLTTDARIKAAKDAEDKHWAEVDAFVPETMRQDPFSVMIILSLLYDNPRNTKLSLTDHNIVLQPPGFSQTVARTIRISSNRSGALLTLKNDSHKQLKTLPEKIDTAIKWFSTKDPAINAIFQRTIWGLKRLLETDSYKTDEFFQKSVNEWIAKIKRACDAKKDEIPPKTEYGKAIRGLWGTNLIGRIITHLNIRLPEVPPSVEKPTPNATKVVASPPKADGGANASAAAPAPFEALIKATAKVGPAAAEALSKKALKLKAKKEAEAAKKKEAEAGKEKPSEVDQKQVSAAAAPEKAAEPEEAESDEEEAQLISNLYLDPEAPPNKADVTKVLEELQPVLVQFKRLTMQRMMEATNLIEA